MSRLVPLLLVGAVALCHAGHAGDLPVAPGVSPDAVRGEVNWVCPALGILTGVSIATGNWIGAGGFFVSAARSGCLW